MPETKVCNTFVENTALEL